jgi:hypothetical protein
LAVATTLVTNLGLSTVAGLANWVAAQLTAAGAANKGAKVVSKINDKGSIEKVVIKSPGKNYKQGNYENGNIKICIKELIVTKPGIGYTTGDTITDGVNTYYPVISPVNGVIISIKPLKAPICGFSSTPNITINSTTGIGAEILPIMTLETSLSNIDGMVKGTQIAIGTSVINVVDCV